MQNSWLPLPFSQIMNVLIYVSYTINIDLYSSWSNNISKESASLKRNLTLSFPTNDSLYFEAGFVIVYIV